MIRKRPAPDLIRGGHRVSEIASPRLDPRDHAASINKTGRRAKPKSYRSSRSKASARRRLRQSGGESFFDYGGGGGGGPSLGASNPRALSLPVARKNPPRPETPRFRRLGRHTAGPPPRPHT